MSSDIEENSSFGLPESPVQIIQKTQKLPRISYNREFLLSLSDLDICKKLPSGFNESVLCEFLSASNVISEQQRNLGGSYFQNSKYNGYGYPQSTRMENSTNYSRGGQGRWDTRSSGSSDREELQADRESESGRRYLNPSRRSWQQSEHDGLLGKPSGYSGQASTQKTRGNAGYQLNKTTEPYQPPRSYKTGNYSRSGTDSFNAETFGSSECSDQGRAEEEKKRRASFELMRREQQKTLQEKRKQILDQQKEDMKSDITASPDKFENSQTVGNSNISKLQSSDSSRSPFQLQASAPRPLVPPGFGSNAVEKKLYPPSLNTSQGLEVGTSNVVNTNPKKSANGFENSFGKGADGKDEVASLGLKVSDSSSLEATARWKDVLGNDSIDKKDANVGATKFVGEDPKSILDKLFQNAFARNDGRLSDFIEHQDLKEDQEAKSPPLSLSSKFSHLFLEDQKKLAADDLFSLADNNDKVGHQVSANKDVNIMEIISSDLSIENEKASQDFISFDKSSKVRPQESKFLCNKPAESSDMFTCEYIEQLMLAEANAENSSQQHLMSESLRSLDLRSEPQKNLVNDHASQHLLSLLHKVENPNDSISSVNQNTMTPSEYFDFPHVTPSYTKSDTHDSVSEPTGMVQNTDGSLTLEALFGTAFMKELQSVEAPLSAQRGSAGGYIKPIALHSQEPEHTQNADFVNGLFSSTTRGYVCNLNNEANMAESNVQGVQPCKGQEFWTGSEILESKHSESCFMDGRIDIHLPEEENLITLGDSINPMNHVFYPVKNEAKHEELLPSNTLDSIADKMAALNAILINERTPLPPVLDGTHPVRGSYDQRNSDPSYQQFSRHQINQTRPLLQQWDSHTQINPQMNFVGPVNVNDPRHPYPTQHHSLNNSGVSRHGNVPNFPTMQHMPMPGNFPLQKVHDYPRGSPFYPLNHIPMYSNDMSQIDPIHGLPLNNHHPGFGSPGIEMPGSSFGNGVSHPEEALGSLIGMDMREKSKQKHLVSGGGHVPGIYGSEINMGLRFG